MLATNRSIVHALVRKWQKEVARANEKYPTTKVRMQLGVVRMAASVSSIGSVIYDTRTDICHFPNAAL